MDTQEFLIANSEFLQYVEDLVDRLAVDGVHAQSEPGVPPLSAEGGSGSTVECSVDIQRLTVRMVDTSIHRYFNDTEETCSAVGTESGFLSDLVGSLSRRTGAAICLGGE